MEAIICVSSKLQAMVKLLVSNILSSTAFLKKGMPYKRNLGEQRSSCLTNDPWQSYTRTEGLVCLSSTQNKSWKEVTWHRNVPTSKREWIFLTDLRPPRAEGEENEVKSIRE